MPNASTHRLAMQLQSLGKLTRQIRITRSVFCSCVKRSLFATRSITSPHASGHMTLVWFRMLPK